MLHYLPLLGVKELLRGLPFDIQGGGGRDIFFNMIQLMVIFFQLYG